MKKLLILLFGVFSSVVGYAQSSIQLNFSNIPFYTNFINSVNEFDNVNANNSPIVPSDLSFNLKFSYSFGFEYHKPITEKMFFNIGYYHNHFRYDVLNQDNLVYSTSFVNNLIQSGLSFHLLSRRKGHLITSLNTNYHFTGISHPQWIIYSLESNILINDEVYRTELKSTRRGFLSDLLLNFKLQYIYNISKTSGIGLNIGYTSTFTQPYSLQFESAWKRPGEDFFTKVEKTETSRFNFGFMNVGISYVYHFKKKEK
jgi:hypothetical protein